jgi:hypothetical protein
MDYGACTGNFNNQRGIEPNEIDVESWELKSIGMRIEHQAYLKCSRKVPITRYAPDYRFRGTQSSISRYNQQPRIKNIKTRDCYAKVKKIILRRITDGILKSRP